MKAILLISHGLYAQEFKNSLKMIAGPVENVFSACLESSDGPEEFDAKLVAVEEQMKDYDQVLIFADLFGGSPCNTAFQRFIAKENVNLIAGMNFPMVLTAILSEDESLENLVACGQEAIVDVRAFSKSMMSDDED